MFAGILVGLVTAVLFDRYHTIQLPSYLGFFGGRRFVPIVVSVACLIMGFALSYFYPIFDAGLTSVGEFIGGAGAFGAFTYGFANRMLIPLGLHHILNTYIWFLYGDYQMPGGNVVTGELTRFAAGDTTAGLLTSGFYPILMFGLPAAALAMIHMANPKQKKIAFGILGAAGDHRVPHRRHRAARVRVHVRGVPAVRGARGAHRPVAGDRLHAGHPPRLLVLRRPDRLPALRHRPGRATTSGCCS